MYNLGCLNFKKQSLLDDLQIEGNNDYYRTMNLLSISEIGVAFKIPKYLLRAQTQVILNVTLIEETK